MALQNTMAEISSCSDSYLESTISKDTFLHSENDTSYFWYNANTKYGTIYIGLIRDNTDSHSTPYQNTVLEVIKTISREEGIVRLVEDWLETGLNLRPEIISSDNYHTIKISNRNNAADNINNKIYIKIDSETLKKLPIPNWGPTDSIYINSSEVAANVMLSSNTIETKYSELLYKDGILLIPESFADTWIGLAKAIDIPSNNIIVNIGNNLQTVSVNNEMLTSNALDDETAVNTKDCLNITIDNQIKLPLHLLLGWTNSGSYILNKPINSYKIYIKNEDACLASGHLVPVSKGYLTSLWLNSILNHEKLIYFTSN